MFLDAGGFFDVLFGFFFLVVLEELSGLALEDVDFVLELLLLVVEFVDFDFELVHGGFNLDFFLFDLVDLRLGSLGDLGFFFLFLASENLVKEGHFLLS